MRRPQAHPERSSLARWLLPAAALAALAACAMPRSAGFGQTAMPLPSGAAEVGISPGLGFQATSGPPIPVGGGVSNVAGGRNLALPAGEGNLAFGLTDTVGLNLHFSPAGVQSGAKLAFPHSSLSFALMPELGLAYWSRGSTTTQTRPSGTASTDTGGTSNFGVLFGAKAFASHSSGLYAGAGYAYQRVGTSQLSTPATTRGSVNVSHALSLAAGFELGSGAIKVRPEMAVVILPVVGGWNVNGATATWAGSGSELVLFPNVTVALQSAHPAAKAEPEGMSPDELSRPPVFPVP